MVYGRGKRRQIVATSLALDSPSVGISMPAGSGKSSMLRLLWSQMLYKGCLLLILDWKMLSHVWAFGCPNVWYAGEIDEIHDACCWAEEEITRRKRAARKHAMRYGGRSGNVWSEDVVGPRLLIGCEEANVTARLLRDHWHYKRRPDQPKYSPAIRGLEQAIFTGREFAVNTFISGQMLSHRAAMSSEARENMGTRVIGWYTSNNWKMLAPEHPMPPRTQAPRGPRPGGLRGHGQRDADRLDRRRGGARARPGRPGLAVVCNRCNRNSLRPGKSCPDVQM